MNFIYHKEASSQTIVVEKELFNHIFHSRRQNTTENMFFRNLIDDNLYEYKILNIQKRKATFEIHNTKNMPQKSQKKLHIGWCIIDTKEIEKSLVVLNELGVAKISFMYCQKSQSKYKINKARIENILISSCQQCGRSDMMETEELKNLQEFREKYPNATMLNFSKTPLDENSNIKCILIGPEGGWSNEEQELYKNDTTGLKSQNTFKSSSITIAVASKLLL